MNKKQKRLEKALKLAGIEREKFDDVMELLLDDEEDTQEEKPQVEEKDEKVSAQKETPKTEEVKVDKKEETSQEKEITFDSLLEKIAKLEKVVYQQDKKLESVEKTQEKTKPVGATPKSDNTPSDDDEIDFNKIFAKYNKPY